MKVSQQVDWGVELKIYNFNMLSDSGATFSVLLTKEQMEGTQNYWINTTIDQIPERFWHGSRLYGEVSKILL